MQIPEALPTVTNLDRGKLMDRIRKLQTRTHRGARKRNTGIQKRVHSTRPASRRIMKQNPRRVPTINNAYLNFLRDYRKKHKDLSPQQLVRQAARAWCRMSEEGKLRYHRKVSTEVSTPVHPALMS